MTSAANVPGVLGATIHDAVRLPDHLPNGKRVDPWAEAAYNALLFTVPHVARYLVRDGATIGIEAAAGADENSVESFCDGTARGILIHQRGELALEAATVMAPRGHAVAISSYSAVGKSTLAAELCRRGWRLIADDITRITWTGGRPVAWPSHDALKLWRDTCETLGIDTQNLKPVRTGMKKYHVNVSASAAPATLLAVVRLAMAPEISLAEVSADYRHAVISECTFRRKYVVAMGLEANHNRMAQWVAGACRIAVLNGARYCARELLADQIERSFA